MSDEERVPFLHEDSSEDNISQFVHGNNSCEPSAKRVPRSLPPGTKYHFFISYSSHDQTYVLDLKTVLEGLGFKCMLADHDFSYGVSVMQNIETTIQTSHKLLLVVSQHFLSSVMCDKEVDMAHKYAADIGRKDFLIVLRLDESGLPLRLDYLTYINGVGLGVKDVGCEIDKKFDFYDVDVPHTENTNGKEIVRTTAGPKTNGLCCNSSYEFSGLTEFQRNKLLSKAMEKSKECYQDIIDVANKSFLFKRYAVFDDKCMHFSVLLALGVATFTASSVILFARLMAQTEDNVILEIILIPLACSLLTIGLHQLCIWYFANQMMGQLCSIMRRNTDCKTQNYIVIPRWDRDWLFCLPIFISIISYDMKPCWNFIEQRAREHWPQDTEESIYNKGNEEMINTILRWFTGSNLNLIPQVESVRHRTYQNRRCLCQLATSPWTFKKSDQIMEDSQSEETCLMKIAGSDMVHETSVKEIGTEYVESKEGNNETHVIEIYNREEDISSYSNGTRTVGGSTIPESGSSLSLTGAEGGTSLTETACRSLFDSDIDRWCGDLCDTRVRGESTSTKQPQVSYELVTLADCLMTENYLEMSTSFQTSKQAKTRQSGDKDTGCFRGHYSIDEETYAKVPK